MPLASPYVLLHKLGQLDVHFLRKMLKVEGWLKSISVSAAATRGSPSLHSAVAQFGWNDTVDELLSKGARVSEQDAEGNTALHVAFLMYGEALVVDLLMKRLLQETTRNIDSKDGLCLVHIICTRPYTEFLKRVLASQQVNVDCKVNPSSRSPYAGYTPLHFAVKFEQHEVAELLLARYNANLNEQDARGSTPLHLALECDMKMLDLLLAYDRKRENVVNDRELSHFMAACAGTDELAVKEYLQAAPSQLQRMICGTVDDADDGYRFAGCAPLHFAMEFDRASVAQLLVESAEKMTPVDLAAVQTESPGDGRLSSSRSDTTESSCGDGESNVYVESVCFVFEILAFAMFLLLLLPSFSL